MIRSTGLRKSFTTPAGELQILKGIDLDIEQGEFVSIVGASGAGKSTLLHVLGTLDRPTEGSITLAGRDILSMGESELTAFRNVAIGFVFQFHHLLPEFTAIENAMMPLLIHGDKKRSEAQEQARGLLERLGLADRVEHRPGELSGGEQQRVAVARALIMEPKIVLADEPTGNLDTKTGRELFSLMRELNRDMGTTFFVATHNEELSSQCDRIVVIKDGRIDH